MILCMCVTYQLIDLLYFFICCKSIAARNTFVCGGGCGGGGSGGCCCMWCNGCYGLCLMRGRSGNVSWIIWHIIVVVAVTLGV